MHAMHANLTARSSPYDQKYQTELNQIYATPRLEMAHACKHVFEQHLHATMLAGIFI